MHYGDFASFAAVCLYVTYFRRDSKAEQYDLYDRHSNKNQHRTLVAQYMVKLFLYESNELFHIFSVYIE